MLAVEPLPILQTKLHPPRVVDGPILRPDLFALLDRGENDTVTLVSAPPGYGKSVLLATWLAERNLSFGWFSIDDGDNDFKLFLQYFIGAIQKQHPHSCHKITGLFSSTQLSDPVHLANILSESLLRFGESVLLILDDFHCIRNKDIKEFLSVLIRNPSPLLRLIILTRRDPALPLNTLRSQGALTEIRMQDLRFKKQEMADLLRPFTQEELSEKTLHKLDQRIEGWAAGLRLVSLNLRYCENADEFLGNLEGSPLVIREYLMNEVLAKQPSPFRECLLKVAVLDRFCAELCEDLCLSVNPELRSYCKETRTEGEFPLMPKLLKSNLFMIGLDDEGVWYRFHHLFQDFLLDQLKEESGEAFIQMLHAQAAQWYAKEGLVEEAVEHALKGNDADAAVTIVTDNLQSLFQREQDARLMNLVSLLPASLVSREPVFMLLEAWTKLEFLELEERGLLEQIETRLAEMPAQGAVIRQMSGSVHVMRCVQYYEITDTVRSFQHAEKALALLADEQWVERGTVMIMKALILQMEGSMPEAHALIFSAFEDKSILETSFHTRLLAALCFMNWLDADLDAISPASQEIGQLGKKLDLPESIAHSLYFDAIVHYERNEIDEAEDLLTEIVEDYSQVNINNTMHSAFALSLVYIAQQRLDEADELIKNEMKRALSLKSAPLVKTAEAMQAEINMRHGKMAQASMWAKKFTDNPRHANLRFYVPHITQARIFIAEGTSASRKKALKLLQELEAVYIKCNNRRFLIHVLVLSAVCHQKSAQEQQAMVALKRAVVTAQPGGFIKLFLDAGIELVPLLNRLKLDVQGVEYVGRILSGFTIATGSMVIGGLPSDRDTGLGEDPLVDALTERELEVLYLLSSRLSNKEIGEKLFIAPGTVKRHTNTIYRKLNVHGRKEAVAKAQGLGFLRSE